MSKHTPGPWTVGAYQVTEAMLSRMPLGSVHVSVAQDVDSESAKGLLIAVCGDPHDDASHADARLMSAAPDMYEAIGRFRAIMSDEKVGLQIGGQTEDALVRLKEIFMQMELAFKKAGA